MRRASAHVPLSRDTNRVRKYRHLLIQPHPAAGSKADPSSLDPLPMNSPEYLLSPMRLSPQPDLLSPDYIRSVVCPDGYRLRYRHWPALGPAEGSIVLVNGMMSHSGWFLELAYLLTGLRLNVVGADRRGSGLNESGRGDAPSRQALLSDLRGIIRHEGRGSPVYLMGWSWGGVPVVNAALEFGHTVAGLILLAPSLFPSPEIQRLMEEEKLAYRDFDSAFPCLCSPLTPEMYSHRKDVLNFIRHDQLAQRVFTARFFHIAREMSLVACNGLSQLTQPILLLMAAQDEAADNDLTAEAFHRLPEGLVTIDILDCRHGMQFEAPHEIVLRILRWLRCESRVLAMKRFRNNDELCG
jgi:acylglycerol lipase